MPKGAFFKNYISWSKMIDHHYSGLDSLNQAILNVMPYRVIVTQNYDMRDVGENTTANWTAYAHPLSDEYHYFFEKEEDAVGFKLRFS